MITAMDENAPRKCLNLTMEEVYLNPGDKKQGSTNLFPQFSQNFPEKQF